MTDPHSIGNLDPVQNQDPTFAERLQARFADIGGLMLQKASEHPVLASTLSIFAIYGTPNANANTSTVAVNPPGITAGTQVETQSDGESEIALGAYLSGSLPKVQTALNKYHLRVKTVGPGEIEEFGTPYSYTITEKSPKNIKGLKFVVCCNEDGHNFRWTDNLKRNRAKKHIVSLAFKSGIDPKNPTESSYRSFSIFASKNRTPVFWQDLTIKGPED